MRITVHTASLGLSAALRQGDSARALPEKPGLLVLRTGAGEAPAIPATERHVTHWFTVGSLRCGSDHSPVIRVRDRRLEEL